jgi:hypothetical protein
MPLNNLHVVDDDVGVEKVETSDPRVTFHKNSILSVQFRICPFDN